MNNTCFVIMPIKSGVEYTRWKSIYDFIKPIIEEHFNCIRADEIAEPGNITHDIVRYLINSYVVVADLSEKNSNVYYELGIRHSFSNRTILLSQSAGDITFDIGVQRAIIYDFGTEDGREQLKDKLACFLKAAKENPDKIDSPVMEYLFYSQSEYSDISDILTDIAIKVGEYLCGISEYGLTNDPTTSVDEIAKGISSNKQETEEALDELKQYGFVFMDHFHVWSENQLYWLFDRKVKGFMTENDAYELAKKLVESGEESVRLEKLGNELGWDVRRVNPAATWLVYNDKVKVSKGISGFHPYAYSWVDVTPATRRFVKEWEER